MIDCCGSCVPEYIVIPDMNPFAQFAFGAKPSCSTSASNNTNVDSDSDNEVRQVVDDGSESKTGEKASPLQRKRTANDPQTSKTTKKTRNNNKCGTSNKSSPEIMAAYWIELKGLTSNYPFAVLLTGVLGAQTRDIVTVGVMKDLAASLGGDICPLNICSRSFDELEFAIKRLNYCHKKTRSMMDLAAIFRTEPVPSTMHGLKTIPGVGPVISEIILRIAFGAKFGENITPTTAKDDVKKKECDHEVLPSPIAEKSDVHSFDSSDEAATLNNCLTPVYAIEHEYKVNEGVIDLSST